MADHECSPTRQKWSWDAAAMKEPAQIPEECPAGELSSAVLTNKVQEKQERRLFIGK